MTDPFITAVAAHERQKAYDHLYRNLIDWRKQLWPNRALDPIYWIEERERARQRLNRFSLEDRMLIDFASRTYGGRSLLP